jgi:crotonobetainyl-CoA:carnitine CoA-transferase CaiB-like acyl-CoA transferase
MEDGESLPLRDLRVVTLEHAVAAPLCTRHLADLGADVVKVEHPDGGDLARGYDSVVAGQSAYFVWANRGKRSVALDLKDPAGLATLGALLDRADVFVHNLGPGAVERLGLGRDAVSERWPRLIDCAISGYGSDGPYGDRKAFDLLVQGESGLMSVTGTEAEPCKVGISMADMCAGLYALTSILAALRERDRTGAGRPVDIALLDCLAEWMMAPAYHALYGGREPARAGARHNMIVPYGTYAAGDGRRINLAAQSEGQWRRLCEDVLGSPELADDPRFRANEDRVRHREALEPLIEEALTRLGADEAERRLRAADIPVGAVNDLTGLLGHPQLAERGRWFEAPSPGGPVQALRPPFNLGGVEPRRGAVPALGEHTEAVRAELEAGR